MKQKLAKIMLIMCQLRPLLANCIQLKITNYNECQNKYPSLTECRYAFKGLACSLNVMYVCSGCIIKCTKLNQHGFCFTVILLIVPGIKVS